MCHQYHIGEFAAESIPPTRIDELDKTKPETPPADDQNEAPVSDAETQNTDQLGALEPETNLAVEQPLPPVDDDRQ